MNKFGMMIFKQKILLVTRYVQKDAQYNKPVDSGIQYRHLIPAQIDRTIFRTWLHKHHIEENRPSNTGLKTFTGNCMHCFQLNYIHSKVSLTATVFILCFFDELICHYPSFPLSIHLLLLSQTDKLIFVFYPLYVI